MFPITSRISHLQRIFCCVFRKHGETSPGAKLLFTPEQQGREVGTARLPAVTLPCLECLITHIHSYLYYYPYYFIYILLYYHIGVLMYCYIV